MLCYPNNLLCVLSLRLLNCLWCCIKHSKQYTPNSYTPNNETEWITSCSSFSAAIVATWLQTSSMHDAMISEHQLHKPGFDSCDDCRPFHMLFSPQNIWIPFLLTWGKNSKHLYPVENPNIVQVKNVQIVAIFWHVKYYYYLMQSTSHFTQQISMTISDILKKRLPTVLTKMSTPWSPQHSWWSRDCVGWNSLWVILYMNI